MTMIENYTFGGSIEDIFDQADMLVQARGMGPGGTLRLEGGPMPDGTKKFSMTYIAPNGTSHFLGFVSPTWRDDHD